MLRRGYKSLILSELAIVAGGLRGRATALPDCSEGHPQDALSHFLSGSASNQEVRTVVRHLLARCPTCICSTQPLVLLPKLGKPE
jgi:hypothetical protein